MGRREVFAPPTAPAPRATAPDIPSRLAAEIRELINEGKLSPGQQLRQQDLARRFGISRVPVRETLSLLVAEAAVRHDPNRGFHVAPLSSCEARQLYRIRHLLETELLSTVRWPDVQELADLRARLALLDHYLTGGARAAWVRAHRAFHGAIFALSPDSVLRREVMRLMRQTDRYRALASPDIAGYRFPADPEHHLVETLAAQDRAALLQAYGRDRSAVEERLLASLTARGL
ncbi:GntR family transcriptional regulator [Cupriavidus sp. DF5525]|uniref:GntR family transcriptional regulator n=1 Tax=Cupriavidus sp. DF5525 TaxID=3160989 RepID=UPI0032DF3120